MFPRHKEDKANSVFPFFQEAKNQSKKTNNQNPNTQKNGVNGQAKNKDL
jgi:hypothetical protein